MIPDEAVEAAFTEQAKHPYGLEGMRAALTAAAPMMVGWRKIEGGPDTTKAPWDGSVVLLVGGAYQGLPFPGTYQPLEFYPDSPWLNCVSFNRLYAHVPTHWSPILPPPAEGQP